MENIKNTAIVRRLNNLKADNPRVSEIEEPEDGFTGQLGIVSA